MEDQNLQVQNSDQTGDYVTRVIPQDKRKSGLNLFNTTAGWIICLSTMFTSGTLVAHMSFKNTLLAGIIGMAILTIYGAPMAGIGSKLGVSTTMIARHTFGKAGAVVFGLINALLNGIGWFAFQAAFFGLTMSELFPQTFLANPVVGSVLGGILMTLTAMFGYKGISILSFIAVPLIIVLSLFGGIAGVESSGGWANLLSHNTSDNSMTLFQGITAVVGNAALGAVILSDITRYGKKPLTGAISAAGGYMVGGVFCILAGAAMSIGAIIPSIGTTPNLPKVMLAIGLGLGALVVLVLAQWTTNTANVYSGSLSVGAFVPLKQTWVVLILGTVGTLLAAFNVYALFIPFLNILGTTLPPIAGVILADYYFITRFVKKEDYHYGEGSKYAVVNWLAFAITIMSALIASQLKFFTPSVNSIVIAFVSYSILALLLDKFKVSYHVGSAGENAAGY